MTRGRHRLAGVTRAPETIRDLTLAQGSLDRAAHRRGEPGLLDTLLDDPGTRVLELVARQVQLDGANGALSLHLRRPRPEDHQRLALFLGQDVGGPAHVAVVGDPVEEGAPRDWHGLREVATLLDDRDAGMFTTALALANWHAAHTHCPRCGHPTTPEQGGWVRRCGHDGSEHYPRTDVAVIMSVTDADDRLLLARGRDWPEGRFSVLAGFLEPGESLEAAVAREVREEVGLDVEDVTFLGNQPWPFPTSLMVGFTARAVGSAIALDSDEIAEAFWVTRQGLTERIADGRVVISSRMSISYRLMERWFGRPLPAGGDWRPARR